jgi:hypothetical protein
MKTVEKPFKGHYDLYKVVTTMTRGDDLAAAVI